MVFSFDKVMGSLAVLCIVVGVLVATLQRNVISPVGNFLDGTHSLMALETDRQMEGRIDGTMFLLIGSIHGEVKDKLVVKFIWQNGQGEWMPTVLEYEKVRLVIANDPTVLPNVKFKWNAGDRSRDWYDHIVYAVITVRDDQIVKDIKFKL